MYNLSNSEELRDFFNIHTDLEHSQRFTLKNRDEVDTFETMLHKHVEVETHLSFHSLNLIQEFDYCMTLDERGGMLFAALFNKKMRMLHHNIDLAVRYRSIYDKLMGIVVMLLNPSKYEDYNKAKSRKKLFPSLVKGLLDDDSITTLIEQVTYLDENYRTPEVHQTGSMRTWVLTSQDLFLYKQLNLLNYLNWVLAYADWIDSIIADNKDNMAKNYGTEQQS